MNLSKANLQQSVDSETVRSVTKLSLLAVWLVVMLFLLTLVPGVDRVIPQTPVTLAAVVGAIITLVLVGILGYLAPKAAALTKMSLDGPQELVEHAAGAVYWLIILVAVLVAHSGLAGALLPVFDGFEWVYDILFMLVAVPVLAVIGARLYGLLDPSSELVAEKVTGDNR